MPTTKFEHLLLQWFNQQPGHPATPDLAAARTPSRRAAGRITAAADESPHPSRCCGSLGICRASQRGACVTANRANTCAFAGSSVRDAADSGAQCQIDARSARRVCHFADLSRGYACTVDCSGHEVGYEWAEENDIDDPDDCGGKSESFIEGCRSYAEEQGADAEDEGDDNNDEGADVYEE
ncbi:hypothetical protein [Rhizobacter sp. Root1221]|uniref:hypothetical protein n=1 Tax=Rhizobacter sp. Root1221 TaxID=1736433 RepID=UPI001F344966|nr:hypothetical protein [Rhizobacter sp. Root1221]